MKQSPELEIIQENMLPGALSAHGFIGNDSRNLADILRDDAESLKKIGVTKEALADKMQELTEYGKSGLGRPVSMNENFEIEVEDYRGKLPCPFRDNINIEKRQTRVKQHDSGLSMRWTDINIHMIREHGFFEGHGSTYRLEPLALAEFLELL